MSASFQLWMLLHTRTAWHSKTQGDVQYNLNPKLICTCSAKTSPCQHLLLWTATAAAAALQSAGIAQQCTQQGCAGDTPAARQDEQFIRGLWINPLDPLSHPSRVCQPGGGGCNNKTAQIGNSLAALAQRGAMRAL
jgi:hypothetical protein